MNNVLLFLSESPISINALQKATGLGQTALTLALVELSGQVAVKDNGVVLAVVAPKPVKAARGRGPIARTLPRLTIARDALMTLTEQGTTTAAAMLIYVGDTAKYTDILLVAREECAKGTIVEAKAGRQVTWSRPVVEE